MEALTPDYDANDLPDDMQPICELIGFEATIKLIETYGGLEFNIPAQMDFFHPIAELLGEELAVKLGGYVGGRMYIPRCRTMRRNARKRLIESMRFSHTRQEIALKLGITERNVYQFLERSS
ncbi:MAG: Mor transcription activator family protein [Leptolyngbyaceae cyanobacterium]